MRALSPAASVAWDVAASEAGGAGHPLIEKEHLLIGACSLEKAAQLLREKGRLTPELERALAAEHDALSEVLAGFALDPKGLRRQLRDRLGRGQHVHAGRTIHRSEACRGIFRRAAGQGEAPQTSSLHLCAALFFEPGEVLSRLLGEAGIAAPALAQKALAAAAALPASPPPVLDAEPKGSNGQDGLERPDGNGKAPDPRSPGPKVAVDLPHLEMYGRDLTRLAAEEALGPIIGRRREILQVLQTLARRSKNNPVLVGEPGVGKTAIVEAIALRAAQGKDKKVLGGKRIFELNLGALLGGTNYRGEFEERIQKVLAEASAHPQLILFIDEIHNLVGAGRVGEGSLDAANLLKPALARGDLRLIGATTIAEYRRYIEADAALERRFERIVVSEPSRDEALEMLGGLRLQWERHHQVRISMRALAAAVDLSARFDTDHQLPDKAIDLVDKAAARTRLPMLSLRSPDNSSLNIPVPSSGEALAEVTELAVAQVLAEKMGLPLELVSGELNGAAGARLLELPAFLKERLIGQDQAVNRVSERLVVSYSGVRNRRGPLATFLLLGPSGVGKTELARLLAEFLFGSAARMIRLDMSEYLEESSVAKLIGSPPGYVGHEQEGQLTGKLRSHPHTVVLLDEVEKAHPRVFDLFLQLFDEGRLTDSKGRTADARNAIVVMTSNLGSRSFFERPVGFADEARAPAGEVLAEVERHFRPEFVNRIDEIVVFRPLGEPELGRILDGMLQSLAATLEREHRVKLRVSAEARAFLARAGASQEYGVRELARTIERLVEIPLSELLVAGKLKQWECWQVAHDRGEILLAPWSIGPDLV